MADPQDNAHSDPHASSDGTLPDTQQTEQQPTQPLEGFDHEIDAEINHDNDNTAMTSDPMNMDGPSDMPPHPDQAPINDPTQAHTNGNGLLPAMEPRIPQKKDASLREFLGKMDDYAPIIPDAVTDYYLTLAGLPPPPETDRRLARLLALATQKFIADVAADAYQYSRIRSTNTTSNNPLTGLGGAAGFGANMAQGDGGEGGGGGGGGKGKKDAGAGKNAPLGGPRAGFGGGGAGGGQGRTVLTMEDLGMAVGEYGVNVKRGEFYR
ncbi:hypothetical protein LTR85_004665 [Meristemomyces frigidus]|nr:hypothetical protein LTR85_004665 [Meristemomyces frigidus]